MCTCLIPGKHMSAWFQTGSEIYWTNGKWLAECSKMLSRVFPQKCCAHRSACCLVAVAHCCRLFLPFSCLRKLLLTARLPADTSADKARNSLCMFANMGKMWIQLLWQARVNKGYIFHLFLKISSANKTFTVPFQFQFLSFCISIHT